MVVGSKVFRVDDDGKKPMNDVLEVSYQIRQLTEEALVEVHQVHEDIVAHENSPFGFQRSLEICHLLSHNLLTTLHIVKKAVSSETT